MPARNTSNFFTCKGGYGASWTMIPMRNQQQQLGNTIPPSQTPYRTHMIFAWQPKNKNEINNPKSLSTITQAKKLLSYVFKEPEDLFEEAANNLINSVGYGERIFKLNKYHHDSGKVVLIGDSAHSMSHALGQGMGCAFEDVTSLFHHLNATKWSNLKTALKAYSNERVPEGNAITDLNFITYIWRHWLIGFVLNTSQLLAKLLLRKKFMFELIKDPTVKWAVILNKYKFWVEWGRKVALKKRQLLAIHQD